MDFITTYTRILIFLLASTPILSTPIVHLPGPGIAKYVPNPHTLQRRKDHDPEGPAHQIFLNHWTHAIGASATSTEIHAAQNAMQKGLDHYKDRNQVCFHEKYRSLDRFWGEPVWCADGYSVRLGNFSPNRNISLVCHDVVKIGMELIDYASKNPRTYEDSSRAVKCQLPGVFTSLGTSFWSADREWAVGLAKEECGNYGNVPGCYQKLVKGQITINDGDDTLWGRELSRKPGR